MKKGEKTKQKQELAINLCSRFAIMRRFACNCEIFVIAYGNSCLQYMIRLVLLLVQKVITRKTEVHGYQVFYSSST